MPERFLVDYNVSTAIRFVDPGETVIIKYFYEFTRGTDATKCLTLEIRYGITEYQIKNYFDFAEGDIFYFSCTFSRKPQDAVASGPSVSLYHNL